MVMGKRGTFGQPRRFARVWSALVKRLRMNQGVKNELNLYRRESRTGTAVIAKDIEFTFPCN